MARSVSACGLPRTGRSAACTEIRGLWPLAARRLLKGSRVRIVVFGATGVLGRALLPVLVAQGHDVVGTSRRTDRLPLIEAHDAAGMRCDALTPESVDQVLAASKPEVVIHLMTDLPANWGSLRRGTPATNALRRSATAHLVSSARRHGVRRLIAESIAFLYSPGKQPAREGDPVWVNAPEPIAASYSAVQELERTVGSAQGLDGLVLRYGALYGPGTWYAPDGDITGRIRRRRLPVIGAGQGYISFVHVDDAATATAKVVQSSAPPRILNIVDDCPVTHAEFLPAYAKMMGYPVPLHVPAWLARPLAGAAGVAIMTEQRAASNDAARQYLGWHPRYSTWRDGFVNQE